MRLNMGQIRNMININNHDELNFFQEPAYAFSAWATLIFPSPKFNTKILILWNGLFWLSFWCSRRKIWRLNDINGVNEYITRGANESALKTYALRGQENKRVHSHGILFISGVQFIQIKF